METTYLVKSSSNCELDKCFLGSKKTFPIHKYACTDVILKLKSFSDTFFKVTFAVLKNRDFSKIMKLNKYLGRFQSRYDSSVVF